MSYIHKRFLAAPLPGFPTRFPVSEKSFAAVGTVFELKFRTEKINKSAKSHLNNLNLKKIQSRKSLNIGKYVYVEFLSDSW